MATKLNKSGERKAMALIKAGHYDTESSWSFSAEDGDALLGKGGDNWEAYADMHLGENTDATDDTKERWEYPFGKGGKVYKRALDAIDSRATQNGDTEIDAAARRLKDAIAKKEGKDKEGQAFDSDALAIRVVELMAMRGRPTLTYRRATDEVGDEPGDETTEEKDGKEVSGDPDALAGMRLSTFDEKNRTVDMTISTGAPVRRWDWDKAREYDEVLGTEPGQVRLGRLNAGAPVLDSHDYYGGLGAMIGSIVPGTARHENGHIRATMKFSQNPKGQAAFLDAKDGIFRNVSVGYQTHKQEIDETQSPPIYRATDWEPYEVSGCPMNADAGAQLRRPTNISNSKENNAMSTTATGTGTPVNEAAVREAAIKAERERTVEIRKTGQRLKLPANFIEQHVNDGTSIDVFRGLAIDHKAELDLAGVRTDPASGTGTGGAPAIIGRRRPVEAKKGIIAARAIRLFAATKGDFDRAIKLARTPDWGSETPVIGMDATMGELAERALVAGIGPSGGFLVQEEYSGEVIDLLRAKAVVRKMGAISLPMPGGNLNLPRLTGGATVSYVGEATSANATAEAFGNLKLSEKKLLAIVPVSNDLLKFANPNADQVVLNDLVRQTAVAEDVAFLRNKGTQYSPKGMRYWAKTTTATVGASGHTGTALTADVQADLIQALNNLETANVPMGNPGWIFSPRTKNAIMNLTATTGQFIYREEMSTGKLYGYPFATTTSQPTNLNGTTQSDICLADFDEMIIGDVPGLEIEVSREAAYVDSSGTTQAAFSQDVTVIRVIERHDFGPRHDESVTFITGVWY